MGPLLEQLETLTSETSLQSHKLFLNELFQVFLMATEGRLTQGCKKDLRSLFLFPAFVHPGVSANCHKKTISYPCVYP